MFSAVPLQREKPILKNSGSADLNPRQNFPCPLGARETSDRLDQLQALRCLPA
jgi:hypothetical protein